MKRHVVILMIALLAMSAIAGKKEPAAKTVSLADQRKAEYIFMEAQIQKNKGNLDAFHDLLEHAHRIDS